MVKFKYYNSGSTFNSSSLSNDDIAFVEDTKSIYTHGIEFGADHCIMTPDANGHEYVDLGLPSGNLWATTNIGASNYTDSGNYYMYGKGSTLYNSSDSIYTGTENTLVDSADTAVLVWGGDWHTPTVELFLELFNNTTVQLSTIDGVYGWRFLGKNGNWIFLPCAGVKFDGDLYPGDALYWTSNNGSVNLRSCSFFGSHSGTYYISMNRLRDLGMSIRPVISFKRKIGLINVENVKSVSTQPNLWLSPTEEANARNNIGIYAVSESRYVEYNSTQSTGVATTLTEDGSESVVYKNTHSTDAITLPIATTLSGVTIVNMDDNSDSLEIPAGGYAEVNFLRVTTSGTTRVFVRSIVSE